MKKFIVIYHAPADSMEKMKESSHEDMQKGMEAWMQWAQKCGSALVDMGTPLGGGLSVTPDGTTPSKHGVVGYSVLQAEDMDGAVKLLDAHPHLAWTEGCSVEVHECLPLPGM